MKKASVSVNRSKSLYRKNDYKRAAELFKVMANAKRLEVLVVIKDREATVNELSRILGTRKSNTSQHLALLRYTGLVKARRQGKNVFYKLTTSKIIEPFKIFSKLRTQGF